MANNIGDMVGKVFTSCSQACFMEILLSMERTYSTNRSMNCVIDSVENDKKKKKAHEMAADWGLKGKPGLGR